MNVVELTLSYNGHAWHCEWQTVPASHSLGISADRGSRVVPAPGDCALDEAGYDWLYEDLAEIVHDIMGHLRHDLVDQAPELEPVLFDPLPEGPLAP